MALGKAQGLRTVPGASTRQLLTLTGDAASYPTGGWPLVPADFGFNVIREVIACVTASVAGAAFEPAVIPTLNSDGSIASLNVALVVGTTGVQLANAGSTTGVVIQLIVEGN